jgi:hypothetical protein
MEVHKWIVLLAAVNAVLAIYLVSCARKTEKFAETGSATAAGAKNADIVLVVKNAAETAKAVAGVAGKFSGSLIGSMFDGDMKSQVIIKVPAASFESAIEDLRKLGNVESESVSGDDVESVIQALTGALVSLTEQRDALIRMGADSKSVDDGLKIQAALQKVQQKINEVNAALAYLRSNLANATIVVTAYSQ